MPLLLFYLYCCCDFVDCCSKKSYDYDVRIVNEMLARNGGFFNNFFVNKSTSLVSEKKRMTLSLKDHTTEHLKCDF